MPPLRRRRPAVLGGQPRGGGLAEAGSRTRGGPPSRPRLRHSAPPPGSLLLRRHHCARRQGRAPSHPLATQLRRQSEAHQAFIRSHAGARLRRAALARHRATPIWEVVASSTTGAAPSLALCHTTGTSAAKSCLCEANRSASRCKRSSSAAQGCSASRASRLSVSNLGSCSTSLSRSTRSATLASNHSKPSWAELVRAHPPAGPIARTAATGPLAAPHQAVFGAPWPLQRNRQLCSHTSGLGLDLRGARPPASHAPPGTGLASTRLSGSPPGCLGHPQPHRHQVCPVRQHFQQTVRSEKLPPKPHGQPRKGQNSANHSPSGLHGAGEAAPAPAPPSEGDPARFPHLRCPPRPASTPASPPPSASSSPPPTRRQRARARDPWPPRARECWAPAYRQAERTQRGRSPAASHTPTAGSSGNNFEKKRRL